MSERIDKRWSSLTLGVLLCAALAGCGEEVVDTKTPDARPPSGDTNAPAYSNRRAATPKGDYVGHLKPTPIEKPPGIVKTPDSRVESTETEIVEKIHFPVRWVVEGDQVTRVDDEIPVRKFRLDFDETQPITYDVLPTCLMTADTHEIVIHRGGVQSEFFHREINDGERCLPVYECWNPKCPWLKQSRILTLFPYDSERDGSKPMCPHCQAGEHARAYKTRQHRGMERLMMREIYRKRRAAETADGA